MPRPPLLTARHHPHVSFNDKGEHVMDISPRRARRLTVLLLALVAIGLYASTLLRFGTMMGR